VAGFVRNLPDGRVELVIEGAPAELDRFMASIAGRMADQIRNVAVDVRPAIGDFAVFEIRH
jgi:acylphosphatase